MTTDAQQRKAFCLTESQRDALVEYLKKRPYKEVAAGIQFLGSAPSAILQLKPKEDETIPSSIQAETTAPEAPDSPAEAAQGEFDVKEVQAQQQRVFFILEPQRDALLTYLQERPFEEVAKGIEFLSKAPTAMLQIQPKPSKPSGESEGDTSSSESEAEAAASI